MTALDAREQRFAYLAAGLGTAFSVALWAPTFDERAGVALAAIGVAMAGLLAAAAKRRSRLLTGIAAVLLAFGPWGMAWLIGLPFLVLAGWLAVRGARLQALEPRAPRPPRAPRRRRRDGEAEAAGEEPRGVPLSRSGPPPASKRYTPPQRRS